MSRSVTFQSGCSNCIVPSALGGGLISDLEKQFKSLISSTKKTVKNAKRKVAPKKTSTKKSSTKKTTAKKASTKKTSTKKTSTKKTSTKKTSTKKKSTKKTSTKKKSTKSKPITKKKSPAKRKSPVKRKSPAKRKTLKGGVTPRPRSYYSGGNFSMEQANSFNRGLTQLGGGSSDFIGTVSSRGPVNYTNSEGSGLSGEQLFRTFNKTGTYMPHDKVNYGSVLTDGILGTKLTGGRKYVKNGGRLITRTRGY